MRKYYLVTTEHLEEGLWFRDESDFIAGMSFVAIQALASKVTVLAFILMSNHVHFVLYGKWKDVRAFIDGLKGRYSKYLHNKYGSFEFLRRNGVKIEEVSSLNEGLEKAVAYTQMNSVAANICLQPTQYQWGTGPIFFSASKRSGTRLGDLSKRARNRLFHSRDVDLPSEWLVGEEGYILPESYVDVQFVESLYRTPKRMNWFLVNSSKAKKRIEAYLLNTTYGNIVTSQSTGLNAYMMLNPTNKTRIMINGGLTYSDISSEKLNQSNSGWAYNLMVGGQQTLPWDIRLSANAIMMGSQVTLQGRTTGMSMAMVGLTKTFLNDRLSFSVNGMLPLAKGFEMSMSSHTVGNGFVSDMSTTIPMRQITFQVSWTFGKQGNYWSMARRSRFSSTTIPSSPISPSGGSSSTASPRARTAWASSPPPSTTPPTSTPWASSFRVSTP